MDGTSEGDVGVGSKAGEAAVSELGNSGGAAAAAAIEAAAMAGEAMGKRAEETRRSIENDEMRARNLTELESAGKRNRFRRNGRGREPAASFRGKLERKIASVLWDGEVYTYEISYYLWLYVCPRPVATTYTTYPQPSQAASHDVGIWWMGLEAHDWRKSRSGGPMGL
jgi:hypothetical protein